MVTNFQPPRSRLSLTNQLRTDLEHKSWMKFIESKANQWIANNKSKCCVDKLDIVIFIRDIALAAQLDLITINENSL